MRHLFKIFAFLFCTALAFAQSVPIKNATLQGTLNGTPTGGTLNLGSVTVSLGFTDGSTSAPGIKFSSDTDTGFYRIGANNLGITAGNTIVGAWSTTGLSLGSPIATAVGSAASPILTFGGTGDGFYTPADNQIGIGIGGNSVAVMSASTLTLGTNVAIAFAGTGAATTLTNLGGVPLNGAGGTPSSLTLTNATGLPVAGGGTGRATSTTAYGLIAAGTTATGAHQTLAAGAITEMLVGGGAAALPAWTQIDYLARITADQTVTNSTTLVDATNLSLSIPAGTYEIDYFQCSYGDAGAGGKYNINFSTAVDCSWRSSTETNNTASASSFRIYRQGTGVTNEATDSSGIGGTTWYGRKNGIFIAASACVVKIQFANVTAAGNTVLQSGTYLRLRRIVK